MNTLENYFTHHPGYREIEVSDYSSGKLRLVVPCLQYAKVSLDWVSEHEVMQYMGADLSNLSFEGEIQRLTNIIKDADAYHWMIEVDGKIIGNININNIQKMSEKYHGRVGKLNTLIGNKNYWGRGVAKATMRSVINWAFWEGGFEALIGRVMPENSASLTVTKKMGFEQIGEEKEKMNNQVLKYLVFKLTKDKWSSN